MSKKNANDKLKTWLNAEDSKAQTKYMEFISDHECEILRKTECEISVTKYKLPDKDKPSWFWNKNGVLDGIKHCPYCGEDLK